MKHPDMIKNEYKRLLVKLDDLEDVDQIEKINKKLTDLDQRLRIVTSGGGDAAKLAKPVQLSITGGSKAQTDIVVLRDQRIDTYTRRPDKIEPPSSDSSDDDESTVMPKISSLNLFKWDIVTYKRCHFNVYNSYLNYWNKSSYPVRITPPDGTMCLSGATLIIVDELRT